jgi:small-conductance mechanosensitive channel
VANISRSRLSTVKQALAISYDDVDKLPALMKDIKSEIRGACPTLIDDGSRGFQVYFTDYKEYSVEVVVTAHFRTKPFCDAYWQVKQDVLLAIREAMRKNDVNFSYVNFLQSGIPMME